MEKTFWYQMIGSPILAFVLLVGCTPTISTRTPISTATFFSDAEGVPKDEVATLNSLEQLDDYPLYTLHYIGPYPKPSTSSLSPELFEASYRVTPVACQIGWGCAIFAALGDPASRVYGRNFDWRFSPALLLFTDPPDGYASVSMVDIEYLGIASSTAKSLTTLTIAERRKLLSAPSLPIDGMNDQGLVIGMAAVPSGEMRPDPNKRNIGNLGVMREILDHARTVDEAIDILAGYNIEMDEVPVHYLIASSSGNSALVEFYQGKMVVFRNENQWQVATNFLVASTDGNTRGQCPRYDRINQRLLEGEGRLTVEKALALLADVSQNPPEAQSPTQWSVVYDMTDGSVNIVMGRKYTEGVLTLHLSLSGD